MLKLILITSAIFFGSYVAHAEAVTKCTPDFIGARCMKDTYVQAPSAEACDGCEKCGQIYYPKCKEGYRTSGCSICFAPCPAGMKDIGVACQK